MKKGKPKHEQYRSGIAIFPTADNGFDEAVCNFVRGLLINEIQQMCRPTRTALAERLGILRERAGRLTKALKLEDYFLN